MSMLDSSIADIIKQKFPKTAEAENIHEPLEDNKMEKDFVLSSQKNLFKDYYENTASAAKNFSSNKTNHTSQFEQSILGRNTVMHGSFCAPFKDSQETNMPSDPWLRLKI